MSDGMKFVLIYLAGIVMCLSMITSAILAIAGKHVEAAVSAIAGAVFGLVHYGERLLWILSSRRRS